MEKVEIHSVNELLDNLKHYQYIYGNSFQRKSFIFRGMSNKNWKLLPGVFREYSEPQISSNIKDISYTGNIYDTNENEILAHFKKESSGFLPYISQSDDFVWIQYAQHYGVPTRLLDFTSNPLIALYFCCKTESKEDGILWVINISSFQTWSLDEHFCKELGSECTRDKIIDTIMKDIKSCRERHDKHRPILFVPAYIDQRMSAQSSNFLLWGKNHVPLEKMVDESNYMKISDNGERLSIEKDQKFLAKIIISESNKHSIINELDLLGVNEKTVFPGLDGIGRYIERYYKKNLDDICEF